MVRVCSFSSECESAVVMALRQRFDYVLKFALSDSSPCSYWGNELKKVIEAYWSVRGGVLS